MSRTSKSRKVGAASIADLTIDVPDTGRRYTAEEKLQLLANLDIEVTHKLRQFEAWLTDALENFRIHQEGLISRIPKPVRNMTIREFQKYDGDVQAASRGLQREKLGGGPEVGEIDKLTRKRKWVASQEAEAEASGSGTARIDVESSRAIKNARTTDDTIKPKPGSSTGRGTAQRARMQLLGTKKTPRAASTQKPLPRGQSQTTLPPAALLAIPTKDGHLFEFDLFQTSPRALDALEGITDSAKKQAKEDVGKLIQAAVDKWRIK